MSFARLQRERNTRILVTITNKFRWKRMRNVNKGEEQKKKNISKQKLGATNFTLRGID